MEPADAAGLLVRAVALQPRGQSVNQVGTQNEGLNACTLSTCLTMVIT